MPNQNEPGIQCVLSLWDTCKFAIFLPQQRQWVFRGFKKIFQIHSLYFPSTTFLKIVVVLVRLVSTLDDSPFPITSLVCILGSKVGRVGQEQHPAIPQLILRVFLWLPLVKVYYVNLYPFLFGSCYGFILFLFFCFFQSFHQRSREENL